MKSEEKLIIINYSRHSSLWSNVHCAHHCGQRQASFGFYHLGLVTYCFASNIPREYFADKSNIKPDSRLCERFCIVKPLSRGGLAKLFGAGAQFD